MNNKTLNLQEIQEIVDGTENIIMMCYEIKSISDFGVKLIDKCIKCLESFKKDVCDLYNISDHRDLNHKSIMEMSRYVQSKNPLNLKYTQY